MKKKWLKIISVLLLILACIFIYVKTKVKKDLRPVIEAKLKTLVEDGSNGLYHLSLDSVEINILKGQITLFNIVIRADSQRLLQLDSLKQAPDDIFNISLKKMLVNGIGPDDLLQKKNISLDKFIIDSPVVEFIHQKRPYNYKEPDSLNIYGRIQKTIEHFSIRDLVIQKTNFTYINRSRKNLVTKFGDLSFHLKNILIDSSTRFDERRFLYAEDAFVFMKDYRINTADNLYSFHFDSAELNASSRQMNISGLSLKPVGNKNEFSKKLATYKDRYDITIAQASVQNIGWYHLLAGENFTATHAELSDGEIEVFADRTLPPGSKSKVGNYPHQLLMKLNMPVNLPTIDLKEIRLSYKELNAKSKKVGELLFNHIKGTFSNVTNDKDFFQQNRFLTFNATASFMDVAPLHAVFKFNLPQTNEGIFSLDAEIDSLDGKKLAATTSALGLFEINSGYINKLSTHLNGNNFKASGTLELLYDDLKITALKPDENSGALKKRGLISFLANNLVLKKSNTVNDDNNDIKQVNYGRDQYKSFFNLIWKTMLDGIKKTVKGKN
jgi:hypothetical protein